MFKFGQLVLVTFPFTNSYESKERPSLVLLNGTQSDLVCAKITSKYSNEIHSVNIEFWKESNLLFPSIVRLDKVGTFHTKQIIQLIGELKENDLKNIQNQFKKTYSKLLN